MKKRIISIIFSISVISIVLLFLKSLEKESLIIEEKNNRLIATQEISQISSNIQTVINLSMQYAEFFDLLIKNNANIKLELIDSYANYILENNDIIDNISIAPNAVVKYIYPIEGNEGAIGHDLLNDPERKEYIEMSIRTKNSVAQGPVVAKQGGLKIFNRRAIFTEENGEEKFWGVTSIVIDFDELLEKFELLPKKGEYLYSLKVHKTNSSEDFIWGYDEIFEKDSIVKSIYLPSERWEIAIYPENGWNNTEKIYKDINYLIYSILALIFFLTYYYINHYQQIKEAAKLDPLTGVYNKRYFERYVKRKIRKRNKFNGLILIDLDKFKHINDTFGHPIGDKILKEFTNRIQAVISDNDKLGRIGGDEFFLFVYDIESKEKLIKIMNSINNKMKNPMEFGEKKINVTCSLGLAICNEDGKTYNELYKIADKNMYKDKMS